MLYIALDKPNKAKIGIIHQARQLRSVTLIYLEMAKMLDLASTVPYQAINNDTDSARLMFAYIDLANKTLGLKRGIDAASTVEMVEVPTNPTDANPIPPFLQHHDVIMQTLNSYQSETGLKIDLFKNYLSDIMKAVGPRPVKKIEPPATATNGTAEEFMKALEASFKRIQTAANMPDIGIKVNHEFFLDWYQLSDLPKANLFIDFKLCDIPSTVANVVSALCKKLTVPAVVSVSICGGGQAMLKAALAAATKNVKIVGIACLTSLGDADTQLISGKPLDTHMMDMIHMGYESGLRDFVCSPRDKDMIRKHYQDIDLYMPGMSSTLGAGSHARSYDTVPICGTREHLVVGRAILEAPDPLKQVADITNQMQYGAMASEAPSFIAQNKKTSVL